MNDLLEEVISEKEIALKVQELGRLISQTMQGKTPLMLCVLKGASIFFADLLRRMHIPLEIDFVELSSYGKSTSSSGEVKILKDCRTPVEGRDVIVVEDIVDSGLSMAVLKNHLEKKGAASVRICALIDKAERREIEIAIDFVGFKVEKGFLVGYGLDYAEKYREIPFICELTRS